jgi:hypothetical protein
MVDVPEGHDAMIVKGKTRKAICKSVTTPDGESLIAHAPMAGAGPAEPMLGEQRRTTRTHVATTSNPVRRQEVSVPAIFVRRVLSSRIC